MTLWTDEMCKRSFVAWIPQQCRLFLLLSNIIDIRANETAIRGVLFSVLTSCAIDRGFELNLGQTNDYKIGICCFSAKHAALRRNNKHWLGREQHNVS